MSQRLFSVPKVGLFLDSYAPGIEKRRDEEVSILKLTLRVQPFDSKLATAIDDGLGDDSAVRSNLFKLSSGEPKPHLDQAAFSLGCPRQQLQVYAAPDAPEARIAFNQVKISGTYARTQKDVDGFAFVLKASFGPVGRDELEYVHAWFRTQRFVTFEEAEPGMFDDEADDDDHEPGPVVDGRRTPMWDDDDPPSAQTFTPEEEHAALQTLSHSLLGKQCFLKVDELRTLTDAEREGLTKWAKAKGGPVWPPVLGKSHVAGKPDADGKQVCSKCGLPLRDGTEAMTYVNRSMIGLDCPGVDLEDARPVAKRGSKKTKKVDPEGERAAQTTDGRRRAATH
jgi:hypothetical protein